MQLLKLTNNSKVRFFDNHNNTFSLRAGRPEDNSGTCPCSTKGEGGCAGVCYAMNIRRIYKAYANKEDFNTELVKDKHGEELFELLDDTIAEWYKENWNRHPFFRIHTSGDMFSEEYAHAWVRVIKKYPSIRFWLYTRTLFAVSILAECENLTLFLSCDPVNKDEVLAEYEKYKAYPNVAIAWMGDEFPSELVDRPNNKCPDITGKLQNKSAVEGPCSKCRICIDRKLASGKIRHVSFPIHR